MPTLVILDILTVVVLFVSKVVTQVVVWFGGCFCCCFSFVSFLFFLRMSRGSAGTDAIHSVSLLYPSQIRSHDFRRYTIKWYESSIRNYCYVDNFDKKLLSI